ncbi:unnamed protein product, partial [Iphiclides podalirius]
MASSVQRYAIEKSAQGRGRGGFDIRPVDAIISSFRATLGEVSVSPWGARKRGRLSILRHRNGAKCVREPDNENELFCAADSKLRSARNARSLNWSPSRVGFARSFENLRHEQCIIQIGARAPVLTNAKYLVSSVHTIREAIPSVLRTDRLACYGQRQRPRCVVQKRLNPKRYTADGRHFHARRSEPAGGEARSRLQGNHIVYVTQQPASFEKLQPPAIT